MLGWLIVVAIIALGVCAEYAMDSLSAWSFAVLHTKPGATWQNFARCHTCSQVRRKRTGRVHVHESTRFGHVRALPTAAYALAWYCRACAPAAELIEAMSGYDLQSLEAERRAWMTGTARFSWSPDHSWVPRDVSS